MSLRNPNLTVVVDLKLLGVWEWVLTFVVDRSFLFCRYTKHKVKTIEQELATRLGGRGNLAEDGITYCLY